MQQPTRIQPRRDGEIDPKRQNDQDTAYCADGGRKHTGHPRQHFRGDFAARPGYPVHGGADPARIRHVLTHALHGLGQLLGQLCKSLGKLRSERQETAHPEQQEPHHHGGQCGPVGQPRVVRDLVRQAAQKNAEQHAAKDQQEHLSNAPGHQQQHGIQGHDARHDEGAARVFTGRRGSFAIHAETKAWRHNPQ